MPDITDKEPEMPKSVEITKADNGFIVRSYSEDKRVETVHETIESAMKSAMSIIGGEKLGDLREYAKSSVV